MTTITIGHVVETGKKLTLTIPKLKHLLIQASSGGGKSNAIRVILERSQGKCASYILDDEGDFVTLRDHGDYVLAAEQGGDVTADVRAAALLARRAAESAFDVIVDISELPRREQHIYVKNAQESFTDLSRDFWGDRLIVIDEAHKYAPEGGKLQGGSPAKDATVETASRGRKRGHKGIFATQRIAKLSKDVAAECHDKLVGLANLSDDRKRGAEELGVPAAQRKEIEVALGQMKPGEFFAVGPAFGLSEVTRVQIDLAATQPPPKGKAARRSPPPRASVERILKQLGDLPKQAVEEAKNFNEAKARIKALEAELRKAQANTPAREVVKVEQKVVEVSTLTKEDRKLLEDVQKVLDLDMRAHRHGIEMAQHRIAEVDAISKRLAAASGSKPAQEMVSRVATSKAPQKILQPLVVQVGARHIRTSVQPRKPEANGEANGEVGKCERAVMTALAQHGECDISKLALLSGYRVSGGFRNSLTKLRNLGYMVGQNTSTMAITDKGRDALGDVPPLPTGEALQQYWLNHREFGKCERAVLEVLLRIHPDGATIDKLAAESGYEVSGGFRNSLTKLRKSGVMVGANTEEMRASDILF